jgi:hypothetical protein
VPIHEDAAKGAVALAGGKTTMARLLAHRAEVQERFPDGVVWVTVGEDAGGPELADKLANVVVGLGVPGQW